MLVAPYFSAMIIVPKQRGRLFFYDATDVCWCPDTGRIYQLPDAQAKIDSPRQNQVRYLLGSVEYRTGEGLYQIYPKKRNEEVSQYLAHLLEMGDGHFCLVVWDNAFQHSTPMLFPFLCDNSQRLMMVNLPTYSPHLNKIEKLWWYMRDAITRNHFHQTFEGLCQALTGCLERLPFPRFCGLMGITPRGQPLAA